MKSAIVILALIILSGCNIDRVLHSASHDGKKLEKIHYRNEEVLASKCALWYPVQIDSLPPKIIYKKGQIMYLKDSTGPTNINHLILAAINRLLPGLTDSVRENILDSVQKHPFVINLPCPTDTIRVDTALIIQPIQQRDSAAIKAMMLSNADKDKKILDQAKQISSLRAQRNILLCVAAGLIILGAIIIYLKK